MCVSFFCFVFVWFDYSTYSLLYIYLSCVDCIVKQLPSHLRPTSPFSSGNRNFAFCPPPRFWLFFFGADGVIRFCHRSWNRLQGEGDLFSWPSLDSSSLSLAAEIKSENISPTNHRNPLFGHRDKTDDIGRRKRTREKVLLVYVPDRTQSAEEKCDHGRILLKIHPLLLGGRWTTTTTDCRQSSALGVCASAT